MVEILSVAGRLIDDFLQGGPVFRMGASATHTFSGFSQGTDIGTSAISVTATDSHGASVTDIFNFAVVDGPGSVTGTASNETYTGGSFADTITGGGGSDTLFGGGGNDIIYGDGVGQTSASLTPTAAAYLAAGNSLSNGLGGTAGFGATSLFGGARKPMTVPPTRSTLTRCFQAG
jgi:Ca2+-binding RTX toxin-like protein